MDELSKIEDHACKLSKLPNRRSEAVEIFSTVLDARRKLVGGRHHRTLITTVNLIYNKLLCGDISPLDASEVIAQLRDAHKKLNNALGANDKNTMAALYVIGIAYEYFSNYYRAIVYLQLVLKDQIRFLGKHHEDTVETMNYLERVCGKVGWDFYYQTSGLETLLDCQTEVLGKTQKKTTVTMERLAKLYVRRNQLEKAKACVKSLLECREEVAGEYLFEDWMKSLAEIC